MPNVLGIVSFRVFPTHMGGQKGVAVFYQYLQKHMPVFLAVSSDNQESPGISLFRILFPNRSMFRNVSRIKSMEQIIEKHRIDVIIAEHSYAGWMAWQLQRRTGKPFLIHSHNIESERFRKMDKWWWKLYFRYERWIHRKAGYNFFISREDQDLAIREFGLDPQKCAVVTYGIRRPEVIRDKRSIRRELGLSTDQFICLFNGTLDYTPNIEAVQCLIEKVIPLLRLRIPGFQMIINGNRARKPLIEQMLATEGLLYTGYVPDIDLYYQAADLFLNPVLNDTGIKTKLVEALANHCTAVSTQAGASGIDRSVCGNKLHVVPDGDWNAFAEAVVSAASLPPTATPSLFFERYGWEHISEKAAGFITKLDSQHARA